jgi:hypothetical protein
MVFGPAGGGVPALPSGFLSRPAGPVGADPLANAPQTATVPFSTQFMQAGVQPRTPPGSFAASYVRPQETPASVATPSGPSAWQPPQQKAAEILALNDGKPPEPQGVAPFSAGFRRAQPAFTGTAGGPQAGLSASRQYGVGGNTTGGTEFSRVPQQDLSGQLAAAQFANMSPAAQLRQYLTRPQVEQYRAQSNSTDRQKSIQGKAMLALAGEGAQPINGNGAGTQLTTADYNRFKAQTELSRMNRGQPAAQAQINAQAGSDAVLRRLRMSGVNPQELTLNSTLLAQMNGANGAGGSSPGGVPWSMWMRNPPVAQAMANANMQGQRMGQMSPDQMGQLYMARLADLQKQGITGPAAHRMVQSEMSGMPGAVPGQNRLIGAGPAVSTVPVGGPAAGVPAPVDPDSLPAGPDKERALMKQESAAGDLSPRVLTDLRRIYDATKRRGKFDFHAPGLFTMNTPENYQRFFENSLAGNHGEAAIKKFWKQEHGGEPSSSTH